MPDHPFLNTERSISNGYLKEKHEIAPIYKREAFEGVNTKKGKTSQRHCSLNVPGNKRGTGEGL